MANSIVRAEETRLFYTAWSGFVPLDRDACYDMPVPVATATFSPNGNCGDLIWDGSLMFEVYIPVCIGGTSVGVGKDKGARGVAAVPFWEILRDAGSAAKDERVSETEFDARRFLFGISGDVFCDLSAPFPVLGRFRVDLGCLSPLSKT